MKHYLTKSLLSLAIFLNADYVIGSEYVKPQSTEKSKIVLDPLTNQTILKSIGKKIDAIDNEMREYIKNLDGDQVNKLSKKIHYIWMGGPLYGEFWKGVKMMARIAKVNGWKVNVWVDNPNNLEFFKSIKQTRQQSEYCSPDKDYGFRVKELNEELDTYRDLIKIRTLDQLQENKPSFFDDREYREFWNFVDKDRVGLKNYAAASDLLRLLICYLEGGIYLDTDIEPGKRFPEKSQDYTVSYKEQESLYNSDSLEGILSGIKLPYGVSLPGDSNSSLFSVKNHPVIKWAILKTMKGILSLSPKGMTVKRIPEEPSPLRGVEKTAYMASVLVLGPGIIGGVGRKFTAKIQSAKRGYEELYILSGLLVPGPRGFIKIGNLVLSDQWAGTWHSNIEWTKVYQKGNKRFRSFGTEDIPNTFTRGKGL
jgi:Glycosyltransferase sugar-binding region containing DXD motif